MDLHRIFDLQYQASRAQVDVPLLVRRERLLRLQKMLDENGPALCAAVEQDFGVRSERWTEMLDLMLVRMLGVPSNPEFALGAIASGGIQIRNEDALRAHPISPAAFEAVVARANRSQSSSAHPSSWQIGPTNSDGSAIRPPTTICAPASRQVTIGSAPM